MLCRRSALYLRQSGQNGSGLIPKQLILFPYIFEVAFVDTPCLVGAFGYLVKAVRCIREQLHHLSHIGKVELDDVAIAAHFSDIGAHVADTGQLHFLFYQFQMSWLNFEVDAGQFFFFGNRFFSHLFVTVNRIARYIVFDNSSPFDFVFLRLTTSIFLRCWQWFHQVVLFFSALHGEGQRLDALPDAVVYARSWE